MTVEEAVNKYSGRLSDPSASSRVTGPCGDSMEFYLDIDGAGVIRDVRFHAEGCTATAACGAVVAFHAAGRKLEESLFISPGLVLSALGGVSEDHKHCAILASTTFYRAAADYMLKP